MHVSALGILVVSRPHGEHGAIVRVLTEHNGVLGGYVRGGRSRAMRPVLLPGNAVEIDMRTKPGGQLASMSVELVESRAAMLAEPIAALAIAWLTSLSAVALPEAQPYPDIYTATDGVLRAISAASSAREWVDAVITTEEVVIAALGYGRSRKEIFRERVTQNGRIFAHEILLGKQNAVLDARERLLVKLSRAALI